MVTTVTRAWLYVRSCESVRIVVEGTDVAVYGPGPHFSHSRFPDEMDAVLYHGTVEDSLVRNGWTLEELQTDRRLGGNRRNALRTDGERRQGALRLVSRR